MTEMEKSGKEDLFQEVKRQHQEQQLVGFFFRSFV